MRTGALLTLVLLAACATPPPKEPLRTFRGAGFVIQDDGCLAPAEVQALFGELTTSSEKILKLLGPRAAPGDFRSPEDRKKGVACPPQSETRVLVLKDGARCHADETGITLQRAHLERKDATHELVHYLAGGSWRPIDEGFAVWLTEKLHGPAWGVSVDVRTRVYLDLSHEDLLDRERLRHGMSRRDYDMSGSFVKWLIDERGLDNFLELYRGAPGNYHGVYGASEQELFALWRQSIKALNLRQDASYYRFKAYLTSLR